MIKKYTYRNAKRDLPKRQLSDNKTQSGKCLVVAGSKGFFGAAILTCLAASRTGAGYTYLKTPGKFPIEKHPDFLIIDSVSDYSIFSAIAVGPGLSNTIKTLSIVKKLIQLKICNVILDAGALTALSGWNKKLPQSWIITPHEGELSRILGVSSSVIRKNRQKYAIIAQKKMGCVVLLKGNKTLVADGKSLTEIQSGNPALAKAGTGDVLTGIILALLSQTSQATEAAQLGAYVHGFIADQWIKSGHDVLSLMASDLIQELPQALSKIRKGTESGLALKGFSI